MSLDYSNGYADGRKSLAWKSRKIKMLEAEIERLVEEVERLRKIEAQAMRVSRAFATGSAWQKERAVKDLGEWIARQPEREEESDEND